VQEELLRNSEKFWESTKQLVGRTICTSYLFGQNRATSSEYAAFLEKKWSLAILLLGTRERGWYFSFSELPVVAGRRESAAIAFRLRSREVHEKLT
jgi:hypothetical protein